MLLPDVFGRNMFDDLFDYFNESDREMNKLEHRLYGHRAADIMKTDIKENKDSFEVVIDLPGFKKEDVTVALDKGYMIVSANKSSDSGNSENKSENEKDEKKASGESRFIHRERYSGSCQRSFYVGENITESEIKGSFKHGILTLNVPKKDVPKVPEKNYISIE